MLFDTRDHNFGPVEFNMTMLLQIHHNFLAKHSTEQLKIPLKGKRFEDTEDIIKANATRQRKEI